jgi:hypothetical protein
MAQFVLVNVVVAVLMKHLEESHKQVKILKLRIEKDESVFIFHLLSLVRIFFLENKTVQFSTSLRAKCCTMEAA